MLTAMRMMYPMTLVTRSVMGGTDVLISFASKSIACPATVCCMIPNLHHKRTIGQHKYYAIQVQVYSSPVLAFMYKLSTRASASQTSPSSGKAEMECTDGKITPGDFKQFYCSQLQASSPPVSSKFYKSPCIADWALGVHKGFKPPRVTKTDCRYYDVPNNPICSLISCIQRPDDGTSMIKMQLARLVIGLGLRTVPFRNFALGQRYYFPYRISIEYIHRNSCR